MPLTLDPALATDEVSLMVVRSVFSGLFRREPDGSITPDLVESWEVSENGLVYTFHLKKGVKFHDGTEVKAEDVVYSINRALLHPLRTAMAGDLLGDIEGAPEAMAGKADYISGVSALDDYTVVIKTIRSERFFPYALAEPASFIVRKPYSAESEAGGPDAARWLKSGLSGTGPYRVVSIKPGFGLILEAFKGYYGELSHPDAHTISLLVYPDPETALCAYEQGAVDVMEISREWVDRCMRSPILRRDLHELPGREVYLLGLNSNAYAPFRDVRVRRAVAHTIDRSSLVNDILKGERAALKTLIPQGIDGHDPTADAIPFDPQLARKLLDEADASLRNTGIPRPYRFLTLLTADSETARAVGRFIAASLEKHLEMNTWVLPLDFKTLLEEVEKGKAEAFLIGWVPGRSDPGSYVGELCASGSPNNYVCLEDGCLDDLLERAFSECDPEIRAKLYALADRIAVTEARWIPLYSSKRFILINPLVCECPDKHRYDLAPIQ